MRLSDMLRRSAPAGLAVGLLAAFLAAWQIRSLAVSAAALAAVVAITWRRRGLWQRPAWLAREWRIGRRKVTAGGVLAAVAPPLLLVALDVYLLWPASFGEPLLSNDHTIHMLKARIMSEELLPRGVVSGWSHSMFAGYPAGELYPVLGEVWIALVDWLTGRALPFGAVYSLGFTGVFVFATLAVYTFAAHFLSRPAAFFAAALFALDPGEFRQGGWLYTVHYGVWPQSLSLAFALLAIVRFDALITRRRIGDVLVVALLVGASVLAHPMGLLLLGALLPLYLVVWWLRTPGARLLPLLPPVALAALLGLLLAGLSLLPFVARRELTTNYGVVWEPIVTIVQRLLDGPLFANTPAIVPVLGLLGLAFAARGRRPLEPFLAIATLGLVFVASQTAVVELDLLARSAFRKLQYERFLILAKPFWFTAAALGAEQLFARWRERPEPPVVAPTSAWRATALAWLVAFVLALFARPAVDAVAFRYLGAQPKTPETFRAWSSFEKAMEWIERQSPEGFWRIATADGTHDHELVAIPAMLGRPVVKVGFTPAENYKYKTETLDWELLRRLGVRYILSRTVKSSPLIEQATSFGALRIYRFRKPIWEPYTLAGGGRAHLTRFDPERIVLLLSGTTPQSRLTLFVGMHPRWTARLDGREVPVSEATAPGPLRVMELPVADGRLVLTFEPAPVDLAARAGAGVALGVMLVLAVFAFVPPLRQRVWPRVRRGYRRVERGLGIAVAVIVGLGVLAMAGRAALQAVERAERAPTTLLRFSDHVDEAEVYYRASDPAETLACTDWDGARWSCERAELNWRYVGTVAAAMADVPRRCIWAHPVNGRELEITFEDVPLGTSIEGFTGIEDRAVARASGRGTVQLEVLVRGESRAKVVTKNEKGKQPFSVPLPGLAGERGTVTFRVTAPSDQWRNFCFDAKVVE